VSLIGVQITRVTPCQKSPRYDPVGTIERYIRRSSHELIEAQAQLRLSKLEAALLKLDLLILDEVGFVPFSKVVAELLFGLLTDRYERGSVLVTSNLDFANWSEVFGDPRLTAALLDRLTHRCHSVEFEGDSFRFKESLRRQARATT